MKIKVRRLYLLTKNQPAAAAAVNLNCKRKFQCNFQIEFKKLTEKCISLIQKHILLRPLVPLVDTQP